MGGETSNITLWDLAPGSTFISLMGTFAGSALALAFLRQAARRVGIQQQNGSIKIWKTDKFSDRLSRIFD
jgi:hypothetical protein